MAQNECRRAVEVVLGILNTSKSTELNIDELLKIILPLEKFNSKMHSKCVSVLEYLRKRKNDYLIDVITEFEEVYDNLL